MSRPSKKRGIKLRSFYQWHRMLGLSAAVFVLTLVATGLMLNHTDTLELDKRFVRSAAVLDWYGIAAPGDPVSFRAGDHWVTQLGDRLYFNGAELGPGYGPLIGATWLQDIVVVAVEGQLLLLSADGEVIERLGGAEGVPAGMHAVGVSANKLLVVRGAHGDYLTDLDSLAWKERPVPTASWSEPKTPPGALEARLVESYRGTGLPLERVLLDIHSGRILGAWGVYLVDAAAVMLMLLALSGFWLWAQQKRKARARSQGRRLDKRAALAN